MTMPSLNRLELSDYDEFQLIAVARNTYQNLPTYDNLSPFCHIKIMSLLHMRGH